MLVRAPATALNIIYSLVFLVLFALLVAGEQPVHDSTLQDIAFWAVLVVLAMLPEGGLTHLTVNQLSLVAVMMVFILPPWQAALIVLIFGFSPQRLTNPRANWQIEINSHLVCGIATALTGLLHTLLHISQQFSLLSASGLVAVALSMMVFYLTNIVLVAGRARFVGGVAFRQFLLQDAGGFPILDVVLTPLAYVMIVLYVQPPVGDFGGWWVLAAFAPALYAQYIVTHRALDLQDLAQQLDASRVQYHQLTQRLPIGIYRTKADGTFLSANDALADLLGVPDAETLLTLNARSFFVDPSLRDQHMMSWPLKDTSRTYAKEYPIQRQDGTVIWVRDTARAVLYENGEIAYLDGALEDITETRNIAQELQQTYELVKRAKQEWESTVDSLPHLVCLLDRDQRVLRSNRLVEVWGLSAVKQVVGTHIADLIAPYSADQGITDFLQHAWEALAQDRSSHCDGVHRKNGQVVHIGVYPLALQNYPDYDQRGSYAVMIVQDITETRRMERELRALNLDLEARVQSRTAQFEAINLQLQREINEKSVLALELEDALKHEKEVNAFKSRFGTLISHEFRTPLTIIQNAAELMERYADRITEERRFDYVTRIRDQVKHLTQLLDDIMMVSRAQTVGLEMQFDQVDLRGYCDTIEQEMRGLVEPSHRLAFNADLRRYLALIDAKMVRQMIYNLVANAVKYSPPGTTITLGIASDSDALVVQVQDEGIGVPEEAMPHLFDAFYRATNVGVISGTGIGLAIVKLVAEAHNGQINVESQADAGTRFIARMAVIEGTASA